MIKKYFIEIKEDDSVDIIELEDKLDKARENVTKKIAIIEKHTEQADRKLAFIKKNGWVLDDKLYRGENYNYEALSAISDYETKLEDIKGSSMKLEDCMRIYQNWLDKYNKTIEFETIIMTNIPRIFIECRDDLAKQWTKWDLRRKEIMLHARETLDKKEFRKLYSLNEVERLSKTESQFYKIERRTADELILDLYNRVKRITGDVTDWKNIHYNCGVLNGIVTGRKGKANVSSVLAGGYNIQRLHIRILVNETS